MSVRRVWLVPVVALILAGCEEPKNLPGVKRQAPPPQEDNFIVGKKTQDIRPMQPELQKGAQVATTTITSKDPITLPGNAYVTIIGRTSILNIQHAVDLWQAENGRYPKDFQEFMDVIIKPNNIALPKLPYYQEYGYNEQQHSLVILEYPDRKNQPPR